MFAPSIKKRRTDCFGLTRFVSTESGDVKQLAGYNPAQFRLRLGDYEFASTVNGAVAVTPEPATFGMLGAALFVAKLFSTIGVLPLKAAGTVYVTLAPASPANAIKDASTTKRKNTRPKVLLVSI